VIADFKGGRAGIQKIMGAEIVGADGPEYVTWTTVIEAYLNAYPAKTTKGDQGILTMVRPPTLTTPA
jgi:hypothetical protein